MKLPDKAKETLGRFVRQSKTFLTHHKTLWIALLLCLTGSIGASLTQTDLGKIDVSSFTLETVDDQYVVADLFRPKTATADHPAPCVIIVPGFQRTKETQISMSLELARRGLVVIAIDPFSQGDSTSTHQLQSATTEGYGLIPMVDYLYEGDSFPFIDKTQIGAAGHSAGGNAVIRAAAHFGTEVIDGLVSQSKLHSVYVTGYVLTLTDDVLSTIRCNFGTSYAYYDEGAYRNELVSDPTFTGWYGDMRTAPEALRLVNSGLTLEGQAAISDVEIGRVYGNPYHFTMRMVNNEKIIHALQPFDPITTGHMLEFFDIAMNLNTTMSYMNQTWWIKELFSGVALVGAFLFILALASLLLLLPFFKKDMVVKAPELTAKPSKLATWLNYGALLIGATFACLIYVPCCTLSTTLFADANNGQLTWFFPERMNNGVMLWAIVSGSFGLLIFLLTHLISKALKKPMVNPKGLKLPLKGVLKSLLFAFAVFGGLYLLVAINYWIFHTDFRLFFIAIKPLFKIKYLIVALMYLPFFFIFYFSNSIRVNLVNRYPGQKQWKANLIAVLANTVGLFAIFAIQYITFATTKTVYYTDEWLFVNMLWSVIPMMAILPLFNRFFFKKTGQPYVGAFVTCLIFIMMMMMNSVAYIPMFL